MQFQSKALECDTFNFNFEVVLNRMKFSHASALIAVILTASGCSTTNNVSENVNSVSTSPQNPAQIFVDTRDGFDEERIKQNQSAKLSRDEQIQLAVEAAVSDRVEPILMDQPRSRTIYFSFSNSSVESKWMAQLKEHARYISSDISLRLMVAGFTDEKGAADFNLKLGKKRADNVCKKLVEFGARKEQLTCVSYGESHPADPGKDDASRARNRRAELLY